MVYNTELEDQARGLDDTHTDVVTAFRCGKEFVVKFKGEHTDEQLFKALTFCDTVKEREWFLLGMRQELYDLRDIIYRMGA